MAIFHLNVACHSRSQQHSAVAGAAYRAGEKLRDDRTGLDHDYSRKKGVLASFMILPEGVAPMSRQVLWDKVEAAEKRTNSTVAREIEIALPHELSQSKREELTLGFVGWLVKKYGFAADVSLHNPTSKNNEKNFHAHIYTSTRALTSADFSQKIRVLDAAKTGSLEINTWREEWSKRVNAALAENNINETVDHRRNQDRGLTDMPTIHEGHGPQSARIKAQNDDIRELNQINRGLAELLKERAELAAAEVIKQAAEQAAQDVTRALDQDGEMAQTLVQAVASEDFAGSPLTPAEISEMQQNLIKLTPTLQDLKIQLLDANKVAQEAVKVMAKAKIDKDRASPKKYVLEALQALPEALQKQEAAKSVLNTLETKGVPWWAPWRRATLEHAQGSYKAAKTQVHELHRESCAPILEEVEKAEMEARKQLATAQKERGRIELLMLQQDTPELLQNAISALLLADAATKAKSASKQQFKFSETP